MTTIHFEDHGQDFLEWDVAADGSIIESRPFQSTIWCKYKVTNLSFLSVDTDKFVDIDGPQKLTIKYPITKMECDGILSVFVVPSAWRNTDNNKTMYLILKAYQKYEAAEQNIQSLSPILL